MKTLTKNLAKRSLSVLLVLMMVFSLLTVGITSASAAEVELEETGAGTITLFFRNDYSWSDIYLYYAGSQQSNVDWRGNKMDSVSGTTNVYSSVIPDDATLIIFSGYDTSNNLKQTVNITEAINTDGSGYFCNGWINEGNDYGKTTVGYYKYRDPISGGSGSDTNYNIHGGDIFYLEPTDAWTEAGAWFSIYVFDSADASYAMAKMTDDDGDGIFEAVVPDGDWTNIIYGRMNPANTALDWSQKWNKTADLTYDGTNNLYTITGWSGSIGTGTWSTYTPSTVASFWVDLDGDASTTIDRIYADKTFYDVKKNNYGHDVYFVCLPSSVKTAYDAGNTTVKVFVSEGSELTINGTTISSEGTDVNLATVGAHPALGGAFSGNVYFKFSSGMTSIHTETAEPVPQGTYASGKDDETGNTIDYENKDDYETKGSIVVYDKNGNQKNTDTGLKKIKGRGNSSWEASYKHMGKYAFNITLSKSAELLDESFAAKKYCLVSYNADEARMRNMLVYELAQQIGIEYTPDYDPVDFYNNGNYIGTYLLTDKVEIGDDETPLVNITNLDDINENFSDANAAVFGNDSQTKATYGTSGLPGYYMYASNLDDPGKSAYEESGFLLELELDNRFTDEFSGFISSKGQEVVCKYPEYATKEQIEFIMGVWNDAEKAIYTTDPSYDTLNEHIDVESFAKMYLVHELAKNLDTCSTSYYVYYDGGKLHAGVTWDFDWTLGQYIQSGDGNLSVSNQTSGKFIEDNNKLLAEELWLNSAKGWWANSREIYPSEGTLNIQAQLCQGTDFWNVVVAEWNEVFYDEACKLISDDGANISTIGSVSGSSGLVKDFYDQVHNSTVMDELKWGLIERDLISGWGSTDTGDNHDAAVVSLHNFIHDRLNWMNTGATKHSLASTDYTLATPEIELSSKDIDLGTEVTITAKCNSSGELSYTLVDENGDVITEVTPKHSSDGEVKFTYIPSVAGTKKLKIKVSSENTELASYSAIDELTVNETEFNLSVNLGCDSAISAPYNKNISFNPSTNYNGEAPVTYSVLKSDSAEGPFTVVDGATTFVKHTFEDIGKTYYYKVVANVEGDEATSEVVAVKIKNYDFNVQLKASDVVNGKFTLTASVPDFSADFADAEISYVFHGPTGAEIGTANAVKGTLTVTVTDDMFGKPLNYSVIATHNSYYGTANVEVTIEDTSVPVNVVLKFKAPDTLAYQPNLTLTVNGTAVEGATFTKSEALFTRMNNHTASYYWYSCELNNIRNTDLINFNVKATRSYFYNGVAEFRVSDNLSSEVDGTTYTYYFALDNLNKSGLSELENVTALNDFYDEDNNVLYRDVTLNVANMITEPDALPPIAESGVTFRAASYGDANCDGKINIKDATYVQKSLANIVVADDFSATVSDFNQDGKVTIKDATAIQKRIAGL